MLTTILVIENGIIILMTKKVLHIRLYRNSMKYRKDAIHMVNSRIHTMQIS